MVAESPACSSWDISGGRRGLDLPPGAMSGKAYHGIPNPGAGAAALTRRVRVRRRADRYSPSGRRVPRQRNLAITPFADRFGPLVPPPLEPVSVRFPGISSGENGHNRGDPQFGQPIRMRGVVGRQVDREAGLDSRNDQAPFSTATESSPRTGLWVKAMTFLPVLAATSSSKSVPSISGPYPGRS